MAGKLNVKPCAAKLTHDTEFLGKMDPYCKIKLGDIMKRTSVHNSAGKFPSWRDELIFERHFENTLTIECWDADTVSNDDLIGEATIPLQDTISKGHTDDWYQLSYKGRPAGTIRVEMTWTSVQLNMNNAPQVLLSSMPGFINNSFGRPQGPPVYQNYPQYPPQPYGTMPPGYGAQPGPYGVPPQGYPQYPPSTMPPGYPPSYGTMPPGYPPQGSYPQSGPPGTYPPSGPPSQYPPQGPPCQYPPQGPPGQYPPQGPPGQYPPQGPPGQYPPPGQHHPQGPPGQYPPQGPPGAPGYYPPSGSPSGHYPPSGSPSAPEYQPKN